MYNYRSSLEKQLMLEQLSEYEAQYILTRQERQQLRRWVRDGNDVTSNPWHYEYRDGWKWTLFVLSEWMRVFTKQENEWQK